MELRIDLKKGTVALGSDTYPLVPLEEFARGGYEREYGLARGSFGLGGLRILVAVGRLPEGVRAATVPVGEGIRVVVFNGMPDPVTFMHELYHCRFGEDEVGAYDFSSLPLVLGREVEVGKVREVILSDLGYEIQEKVVRERYGVSLEEFWEWEGVIPMGFPVEGEGGGPKRVRSLGSFLDLVSGVPYEPRLKELLEGIVEEIEKLPMKG